MGSFLEKMNGRKWEIICLFVIIVVGIFLRTYELHDWLHFGSDQARDAILVEHVVNGDTDWPKLGMDAGNTHFKLGPMYYYFQITAMKLFGNNPAVLAYPDVFFSILAIPLFFLLLRRYFSIGLSLTLTGLFSVSFYAVEYSRFAWNTNPIPFFVMLFLYATLRILESRKKTTLLWVVLLGIALGVGVQLHTLLLLLLPCIFLLVSLYLLFCDWRIWGKLIAILAIAVLVNIGQIRSENETGRANSRLFWNALTDRSESGTGDFLTSLEANVLGHTEANSHILSSLGDKANFTFRSVLHHPEKTKNHILYVAYLGGILLSVIFSIFGYGRLGYLTWNEKDLRKRQFLGLILLYVLLSFLIMFSIARGMPLRYFISLVFVPFILLGLCLDWLRTRMPSQYAVVGIVVVVALFATNMNSLRTEAALLASGMRGESGYVVLGEAERVLDYMIERTAPGKEANFFGGTNYAVIYYKPLMYLAEKRGFKLMLVDRRRVPVSEVPYFFMAQSLKKDESFSIAHFDLVAEKNFGRIGLHQLKKQ